MPSGFLFQLTAALSVAAPLEGKCAVSFDKEMQQIYAQTSRNALMRFFYWSTTVQWEIDLAV